jgi:hypothetical protein
MGQAEKQFSGGSIERIDRSGQLVSVSLSGASVSAKGVSMPAGEVIKLKVDENTTITVNRFYRNFKDLASGQTINKVYYLDNNTATIIHSIDEALLKKQEMEKQKLKTSGDEKAGPAI